MIDFKEYPDLILRMLNSCVRDPTHFVGLLVMQRGMKARLDFLENLDYKWIEHLSMPLDGASDSAVRENIVHRYNKMKAVMVTLQSRLADLAGLVKLRNPSLLVQFRDQIASTSGSGIRRETSSPKKGGNNASMLH